MSPKVDVAETERGLEISAELVKVGTRSRVMEFQVLVVGRGEATEARPGAARVLAEPLVATTATGTVVVPPPSDA